MKKRVISLTLALSLLVSSTSALTAEQAGEILETYYIDEIPEEVLTQPTVEEMLDALGDPYTVYYSEEEYAAFLSSMEDMELVGIGIRAYYLDEGVLVNQVAPDTPAGEAGLQAGDYIVAVDGHDTRGAAEADIDSWFRGEAGTGVRLTVLRGEETFSVTAVRRNIVFPTVLLEKIEDRVGWISCSAFGSTTFQYFYDIITAYDDEVDEWVIDLRGNSGGDVFAALFSAGCFAGAGAGVYMRDGLGNYYSYLFDPNMVVGTEYFDGDLSAFQEGGFLTADPAHVLVDWETASAAELFCVAIRDSGAGLIIGGTTYGKGVAQTMFSGHSAGVGEYFTENDILKVTTERAFSTRGATYDKVGVLPHIPVGAALADEAAALLTAPVSDDEDALILRNLSNTSLIASNVIMPLDLLREAANADAAAQILSVLPTGVVCMLREGGELRTVTAEEAAAACGGALARRGFSDIDDSEFADEIETLGRCGIVCGPGDGSFRPGETLDRASLCALAAKALRCVSFGEPAFADVPADAWYAPYVNALYEMGIVTGYDDGLFHPDDPISHEQFLAILGRMAQWLDMEYHELMKRDGVYGERLPSAQALEQQYGTYSSWARELVWLCDDGLAWADPAEVDAVAATTREEAAAAVYELLRLSGVLPN